jgi:hypothetical protein
MRCWKGIQTEQAMREAAQQLSFPLPYYLQPNSLLASPSSIFGVYISFQVNDATYLAKFTSAYKKSI